MDLNEISEFIKEDGGKFIIVENGKPSLVIMSFDEYRRKIKKSNPATDFEKNPEQKKDSEEEMPAELSTAPTEEDIDIEDLPLE
jgi:prevent-host-death family protein